MSRTDRRPRTRLDPDARRASILEAALQVFAEQPYTRVTISCIARRAGASDALLYRYFAGKEEIYLETVRMAIDALQRTQVAAVSALPGGTPAREQIRATTRVYLDHIATHPDSWALPLRSPGAEPPTVIELRRHTRQQYVEQLCGLLSPSRSARHHFAAWGYFGFLDAACLRWVERGCPDDERDALIDAALGALEGALGDWAA